jgi:hypothetical protein
MAVTQQYAVLDPRPFGRYQRGTVLELEGMRGVPLSKRGVVLKISPREAARADVVPGGALPLLAESELHKILVDRGLAEPIVDERKPTKTSMLKRG